MTVPSAYDSDRLALLRRLGLPDEEATALERIWDGPALQLITDDRTKFLADKGYTALDTLDATWHDLDHFVADTHMQHGLTPHQGFLIHNSPTASHNMWGSDRDIDRVHRLLSAALPSDVIAAILLAANTPNEPKPSSATTPTTTSPTTTKQQHAFRTSSTRPITAASLGATAPSVRI